MYLAPSLILPYDVMSGDGCQEQVPYLYIISLTYLVDFVCPFFFLGLHCPISRIITLNKLVAFHSFFLRGRFLLTYLIPPATHSTNQRKRTK
ncbi:hypothetical protein LY78DRAFT_394182 [Colletotrichum sublineola]|nr:hypothetical protein LY78DRAFT_394182 [Colletotrichum sublineola]